jgi:hypothetical protein
MVKIYKYIPEWVGKGLSNPNPEMSAVYRKPGRKLQT